MMFPVLAGVVAALALSGCGHAPEPVPKPVERLVGGIWQNLRMPNHTALAEVMPACNYYEYSDLFKKVPDECCDISQWPEEALAELDDATSMIHDDAMYTCFMEDMGSAPLQVRNYLGCEGGVLTGGAACIPAGVALGVDPHGYPMNYTFAATTWQNGTWDSCGCSNRSNFEYPAKLTEAGCYVSLTSYQLDLPTATPGCTFTRIAGTCEAPAEYLM